MNWHLGCALCILLDLSCDCCRISNNKIVVNSDIIDEQSNDIDYILSKCHSIPYVDDDDIDTDTDSSVKSMHYRQRYISNVSNHLTSSIIKTVSTKYLFNE